MKEKIKAGIMDAPKIRRVLLRMATEILERNRNLKNLILVGIRTRGVFLARRIAKLIREMENVEIPVGVMDITLYRDDVVRGRDGQAWVHKTEIPFAVRQEGRPASSTTCSFTGRTIRAAMDSLFDIGPAPDDPAARFHRPGAPRAARSGPTTSGKFLPTSRARNRVQVHLTEIDKTGRGPHHRARRAAVTGREIRRPARED